LQSVLANNTRYTDYAAATAYVLGNRVRPTGASDNGRIYECIVPGTSATSGNGPEWPKSYNAIIGQWFADGDGDLEWKDVGPSGRLENYDLAAAESEAWLLKASRVEENVDFSTDGISIKASQEAANYRRRANLRHGVWVA
jgi:hypothetical protein